MTPGLVVSGSFASRHRLGAETGWSVIRPGPGPERLPVCVVLHGLGADHTTAISDLAMDRLLAEAVADGVPPFALATVDGGTTYWHRRPTGEDAGAMVLDELLPVLDRQGLRTDRLAFLGWSMGGYGALRLAATAGAPRVRAVCGLSSALWIDPATASESGFDDAAEYDAYSVFGHQAELDGIAVRLDCGDVDYFCDANRAYVAGFDRPVVSTFEPGDHDDEYALRTLPAQLAFVGAALWSGLSSEP